MNKIVVGAATAAIVGLGGAAGWYYLGGQGQGPSRSTSVDCLTVQSDVDATIAKFPAETKVSYSGLTCDAAANRLGFKDFSVEIQGAAGGDKVRMVFTDLTLTAPNGTNAARIFDPSSYGDTPDLTTRLALVDDVTAARVTIGPADDGVEITDLALSKLAARQFAAPPPTTLAGLGRLSGKGVKDALAAFSFDTLAFSSLKAAGEIARIGSFKLGPYDGEIVDALEINDIAARPPGEQGTLSLAQVRFDKLALGPLLRLPDEAFNTERSTVEAVMAMAADRIALKGFKLLGFQGKGNDVTLDSVELTGLRGFAFDRFAFAGLSGRNGADDVEFSVAGMALDKVDFRAGMQAFIDGAETPDMTKMKAAAYELSDIAVGRIGGARLTLAALKATNENYVDDMPTHGAFTLDDLVIPADLIDDPTAREPLDSLGYEKIILDSEGVYDFDVPSKTLDITRSSISMSDGGTLDFAAKISDFDVKALSEATANMEPPAALLAAKLISASLSYTDNSLADRILEYTASLQGSTKAELRDQAIQVLKQQRSALPGPTIGAAIDQIIAFLKAPKKLTIAVAPAQPTAFVAFGQNADKPEALAKQLGLKVTAE